MGAVRGLQTYYSFSAAHPLQLSAARALNEGLPFLERSRALYREAGAMTARALQIDPPEGGTFVVRLLTHVWPVCSVFRALGD